MTHRNAPLIFPFLLVFYEIATYLSNDMYLPGLPEMMQDLGLTIHGAQLTLTTWFLGSASMPLIMGAISDRFGRRPVLLLGGVIYILTTIICAITNNTDILLVARFIEGGMIASMMVPGYACIHEIYEKREAIRLLATMGSISVLAPALGPLLGSIVLYFSNWRGIFWVIVLWAAIAILLLYKWMPETLPPEKRQSLHLMQLAKSYFRILRNKQFMLLMTVLGFIFAGFITWITAGPLLIIETFHQSALVFGIVQAIVFAAYIFGNRWVKYLLDRLGIYRLIKTGLMITLLGGLSLFIFTFYFPNSLVAFLIGMIIYSFGSALCFSPLNRSVIEASDEAMGVRVAFFTVLLTSFAALGSGMSSWFFDGSIRSLAYMISLAIVIACFFMWLASKTSMELDAT